ncbi:MscS Mechanosensitive ion channel [Bacteroides coprosuis DSM 18011]|uniref:MscS Mechanosensitive ion channel n=1 Tax=Bacteroides coprosuis DSM 18011 TaxID=679937 RepID=F3ZUJ4_9BACE|nr:MULTISPECIES: mechanosensitive ion channel family protein [Bacteroides]EGJ71159.1 MscS Mechanosensitive ion channel [Bacteroides coprosuis DSM 18011]
MEIKLGGYLPQIIFTLATILVAVVLRVIISKLISKYASFSTKLNSRIGPVQRICAISINILAVTSLITIWGVDKQNIFVALSSIFAVIGVALFAQWSILSNVTAGMIIFFNTPFKIGDYIRIQDKDFPMEAKVVNILTFYTHLRTDDGKLHIFPNNLLLQRGISIIGENPTSSSEEDIN